jgi:hypothetical protein
VPPGPEVRYGVHFLSSGPGVTPLLSPLAPTLGVAIQFHPHMAHLERSVATLRLSGDDLVPRDVSALLGCNPTYEQLKGQEFPSKGASGIRIARFGQWRLSATDTEPENLDGQVSELLDKLTQDFEVWHRLAQRFEVNLFCGWFMGESNEGVEISVSTLRALAERQIRLSLDIYAPDGDA